MTAMAGQGVANLRRVAEAPLASPAYGGTMAEVLARPAPTEQEYRTDLWIALGMFIVGVISAGLMTVVNLYGTSQVGIEWALLTTAINSAALAVRRRYPIAVAAVVCATYFASVTFQVPEVHVGNIAMFIALFTAGAWVNNRRLAFWGRAIITTLMMVWLFVNMYMAATAPIEGDGGLSRAGAFSPYVAYMLLNVLINIAFFGGAWFMGDRSWNAAVEEERFRERTRELEAERELTAAQAVALDRVAIARELHDVVAHHVSAMGVQASAARLMMTKDPQAAAEALTTIETSARTAITELRLLLETLRTPDNGTNENGFASTLGLSGLDDLVKHANDAGMPTAFTVLGDKREVPGVVQANLYRIAQESLTNARRHGGPDATADVRLRYTPTFVEIEVSNTGRPPLALRPGLGQLGMRERAAASGGTIELVPRTHGGMLVRAQMPLAEVFV